MVLDIMSQAKNAIEAYNDFLRATSSNVSNQSVTGYKRVQVSFQELFNKLIQGPTPSDTFDNVGGKNPLQLGGGAAISSSTIDFTQGDLTNGSNLSLAVQGNGFFITSVDGGQTFRFTRAGDFFLNANSQIVTSTGAQVYGFSRSGGTTATGTLVPLSLSGQTFDPAAITWDNNGVLRQNTDATRSAFGAELPFQIALTAFPNPAGLQYVDGTAFAQTIASGEPSTASRPNTANLGTVSGGRLEQSNVFFIGETIDALEAQRAMSGALTVVRIASDAIQQFINRIS
jgi:flagellar hook protein FlgE